MSEKRETFTVWITKYALTQGIQKKTAEGCFDTSPTMISVRGGYAPEFYHNNDWHRTEADAINRALEMQANKLSSIEKQRKRIASLKFGANQKEQAR